jgi:hypothetical protein
MNSPSNNIDTWSHSPLEQLHGGRLANAAGATNKDGDEILDEMAFSIAGADGFGGDHLQRFAGEEVRSQCIDVWTVLTTQSNAESATAGLVTVDGGYLVSRTQAPAAGKRRHWKSLSATIAAVVRWSISSSRAMTSRASAV